MFWNILQVLFIWVWTFFSASLGFLLLPFLGQQRAIYVTSQIWSYPILVVAGIKVKVEGLENIPTDRAVIFTSNHESSFDIPVLFWALPVPLFYLVKAELRKIPVFGWFIGAVGMVFVDRKNHKNAMLSLQKAGMEIKKGKNIISFPEGTRTRDGQVKLFKRGSFILALENNIDIVPVAIEGAFEVNPPGYRIKGGPVLVKVGKVILASDFDKENPDQMAKYTENLVKSMLPTGKI